jgi:hypothetical protein
MESKWWCSWLAQSISIAFCSGPMFRPFPSTSSDGSRGRRFASKRENKWRNWWRFEAIFSYEEDSVVVHQVFEIEALQVLRMQAIVEFSEIFILEVPVVSDEVWKRLVCLVHFPLNIHESENIGTLSQLSLQSFSIPTLASDS